MPRQIRNANVSQARPAAAALAFALFAWAANASAGVVFTVDSVADEIDDDISDGICHTAAGTCTLRAAVMSANRASGAGATIVLPAGTYILVRPADADDGDDNGDLNFSAPASGNPTITLSGAGAAVTIIDANGIDRVLNVASGRTATISGLTLRNGAGQNTGGGIRTAGTLTISDSAIRGNNATNGGGVFTVPPGTLTLERSTVDGNTAGSGGGLFSQATVQIDRSTISRNHASYGAGIYVFTGSVFITDSTIALNDADTNGGGIFNSGGMNIYSSTIVGNQADADVDENGGSGGGVYNFDEFGTLNVRNTLIAGNYVSESPIGDDCTGTLGVYGDEVLGVLDGCVLIGTGYVDVLGSYQESIAELGPLQDNGGPTETIALVPPNYAVNDGDEILGCIDQNGNPLPTDQRGLPRVVDARCDVGAYEYQPQQPDSLFGNGFE